MHPVRTFTEAQLQKAKALAGDLSLAPTEEESAKAIAVAQARALSAKEQRRWHDLEVHLKHISLLKHDHVRLFGKRV